MELGISTACFFPRLHTEDCFEEIKKCGADVCEVFLATFSEYGANFRQKLLKNQCVRAHSVHSLTNQFEPEVISKNLRAYDDCVFWFRQVCLTGAALGAEYYTFHGPTLLKKIPYVFDFPFLAQRIGSLASIASEYGITLTYENVHWAYGAYPEYLEKMFALLPEIKGCLDIKQAMQAGVDCARFIEAMDGRIATVHLCDYDADGNLLLPGRGKFDFTALFERLAQKNPDAVCLMEVYDKSYTDFSELGEAFGFLRDCMERAGLK